MESLPKMKTLEIVQKIPSSPVFHVYLNLPATRNALTHDLFSELPTALSLLDHRHDARAIVLAARGLHFCSGIDLASLRSITSGSPSGPARARERLRREILSLQAAISAVESCRRPVLAAVQGACVGGGVDLVAACDARYCEAGAWFSVKEVDLGLAADLGTLQRLPGIVGYGNAMEMALTGRSVGAEEAKAIGLVSRVFKSPVELEAAVDDIARELEKQYSSAKAWKIDDEFCKRLEETKCEHTARPLVMAALKCVQPFEDIAEKSPLAVMGTKAVLQKSRDLTTEQGLDYVATWNASMLISDDLQEAVSAGLQKRKPTFSKL